MPSVKSSASRTSRFAPYEERLGGEAPTSPSAAPELGADVARDFHRQDPVAEEEVPYVAEEYEVEFQAYDYQLDLPPLFEEISPRSDEGAASPGSSTESADSVSEDRSGLDEGEGEAALGDEAAVQVDGQFEMDLDVSDDEDYIDDGSGGPRSPPPRLMYFGCEEYEATGSPDAGATTAAACAALRRATRRLVFY